MFGEIVFKKEDKYDISLDICDFFDSNEEIKEIKMRDFYHFLRKQYSKKEEIYNKLNKLSEEMLSGKNILVFSSKEENNFLVFIFKNVMDGINNAKTKSA